MPKKTKPTPIARYWDVSLGAYVERFAVPEPKRKKPVYDIRIGHRCRLSRSVDYSFEPEHNPSALAIILADEKVSVLNTILEG